MKKKILILTPECPYPLNSGGRQAQYHLIDKLRFIYDISILLPKASVDDSDYNELLSKWDNVVFFPYEPIVVLDRNKNKIPFFKKYISKVFHYLKNKLIQNNENYVQKDDKLRSSLYNSLSFTFTNHFLDYVYNISSQGYDIIQVEFYHYLPLIHILPKDLVRIFVHHEIRYIRNELEMSLFEHCTTKDIYTYEVSKMYELANLSKYDKIITLSEIDEQKLAKYIDRHKIFISPSLVQVNSDVAVSNFKFNNKLVFLGNSNHYPNEDGLKWFLLNIWPSLRKQNSFFEFHLIGKWQALLSSLNISTDNIFVHGYVKDLSTILPNTIMVVPIRIGSGIRVKIFDAINYKIPFITTSIGVEGLNFKSGQDCFIADNTIDFINCIMKVSSSNILAESLTNKAIITLDKLYSEEALINKRIYVYEN